MKMEIDYGLGHCPICGAFFSKTSRAQKYCSTKCSQTNAERRRHERNKEERAEIRSGMKCLQCGAPLVGKQSKFCSEECRRKHNNEIQKQKTDRCECKRKETCIYGAKLSGMYCCDYIGATGKSRGGYPDECTYYKRKTKRGPKQPEWSAAQNMREAKK